MYLYPEDLIDVMHNSNLYALQKGKENLALTSQELNMVMSYIRYPKIKDVLVLRGRTLS